MAKKKTKAVPAPHAGKGTPSTQQYLEIAEIRDGVLIMKDGTLRTVILVSSMNFALKSEDEQQAIVQGYIQFLNTLDFPLQIQIQSRRLDISGYLKDLERREKEQTNDLLRLQMQDYRQYVSELITLGDIMSKKFFVVVPYSASSDTKRGFFKQLTSIFTATTTLRLEQEEFVARKHELDQRVSNVIAGLTSMSLNAVPLDTQSLIELFYNEYNPDTAPQQKMVELDKLQITR